MTFKVMVGYMVGVPPEACKGGFTVEVSLVRPKKQMAASPPIVPRVICTLVETRSKFHVDTAIWSVFV
jgi:hypothetical protein